VKIKKTIYILLVMFLGLLLAQMTFWLIEIWALNNFMLELPTYLQIIFSALGLLSGYFLGQTWWRIVYVEHRHWRNCKK
jgi:hypothetical protein